MFNKDKFRAKMVEKGITIADVANVIGINETTLYRKMNGKSDFSRSEIQILKSLLNMSLDDAESIFFAQELA